MADSKFARKMANHAAAAAPSVASAGSEKLSDEEVMTLTKLLLEAKATNDTRAIIYLDKSGGYHGGAGGSGSGGMSDASKRRVGDSLRLRLVELQRMKVLILLDLLWIQTREAG